MHTEAFFHFDTTYLQLPEIFYEKLKLHLAPEPKLVYTNTELLEELDLPTDRNDDLLAILSGRILDTNSIPIAQAYAGHQFGYFTNLGDGRAALLGEHITKDGTRFDIQLKGSGPTKYSRRGDGKAVLKAVLKEYIFSEAMHYLGIPTSRSLAVFTTGEKVYRERVEEGATLCRVMSSHLRVGTFEFARNFGSLNDLEALVDYTIHRHFPALENTENKALALIGKVMDLQIDLVLNWLRVGFIHGVMNTDNTSIAGETFDYGPCAFMGVYDPETVFSSIDEDGRYAFGNQTAILKWNLARFAESLLPLIDEDQDQAVTKAIQKLNEYDDLLNQAWYEMMLLKLGIDQPMEGDAILVDEFLELIKTHKKDYNHSFTYLRLPDLFKETDFILGVEFQPWMDKWKTRISQGEGLGRSLSWMEKVNPVFVPQNYFVEEALEMAVAGDFSKLNLLLDNLKYPYTYKEEMKDSLLSPSGFDRDFQTFCGT